MFNAFKSDNKSRDSFYYKFKQMLQQRVEVAVFNP